MSAENMLPIYAKLLARQSKGESVLRFLTTILTPKECELLERRLQVGLLLDEGLSYSAIQKQLRVSAATVAQVSEQMMHADFQSLLAELKKERARYQWFRRVA